MLTATHATNILATPSTDGHDAPMRTATLLLLLSAPTALPAEDLATEARYRVPMSCAPVAHIGAADYPEAVRIYDEGHTPENFEKADRAALGLLWRHRQDFARTVAAAAFTEHNRRPPTQGELDDERSRWVRTLMSYPPPLREAVEQNCEALFEIADRSCPTPIMPE
jgi:hypothetical protein